MNWEQIEGKWKRFTGSARKRWGKLTENDWETIAGQKEQLVGRIDRRPREVGSLNLGEPHRQAIRVFWGGRFRSKSCIWRSNSCISPIPPGVQTGWSDSRAWAQRRLFVRQTQPWNLITGAFFAQSGATDLRVLSCTARPDEIAQARRPNGAKAGCTEFG